jgi:hypothetical protein
LGGIEQGAALHRRNEVQHGSSGTAREAMENVASQVHVKGVTTVAAVNRAASPILVFPTPAKLYLVMPKNRLHGYPAFYGFEIQPVDHGCAPSALVAAPATDILFLPQIQDRTPTGEQFHCAIV